MFTREPIDEQQTFATFHWGKWVFSDEPTTGVISCHSLEWIHDACDYHAVCNVTHDDYMEYGLSERTSEWQNSQDDLNDTPSDDLLEQWMDELGYEYEGSEETFLIGSWRFDETSKEWEVNRDAKLKDEDAYAAIVDYGFSGGIVQVVWSRFVTRGALCSPCCPGQCDMDTEGEYLGYDLPLSFYGDSRENTYPQLRYTELILEDEEILYELSSLEETGG